MNDPLVHITTGAPCKGKLAAKALAVLVLDPRASAKLRALHILVQAEEALVPFGWPDREALAKKLELVPTRTRAHAMSKAPSHSNPRYLVSRIRKLLTAKGWPLHIVKGRYQPFGGGTQRADEGFGVSKIGVSKSVSISYCGAHSSIISGRLLPVGFASARVNEAIEYLRSLGYRVDDRGWIECDNYDDCD